MRVLVAALLAVAVTSGCVGLDSGSRCAGGTGTLHTPWVDATFLHTDPHQPWDTVVLLRQAEASVAARPAGWTAASERLSPAGDANFSLLRVDPGKGVGQLDLQYRLEDCDELVSGTVAWDLAPPEPGASAQPGQGTHVYTAGFWENGTLFYTNIEAVDHSTWPRAGWYAWEGGEPLPVYVYDDDRSEQPAVWMDPQAGTPLAGTVPGVGYFTTIPGFNEALKGLSTSTVRVVRMSPEEAYTRPGNEEHPLYGHALVFYIKVIDVVDLPCPMGVGQVCGVATEVRA